MNKPEDQLSTTTLGMQLNMERQQQLNLNTVLLGLPLPPKERYMKKLIFRVLLAIILHRKAGSGNEHSQTITPMQSGAEYSAKLPSNTITAAGRDCSCKNISGGTKEKPPNTTSSTQRECPCQHWHGHFTQDTTYTGCQDHFLGPPARDGSLEVNRSLSAG